MVEIASFITLAVAFVISAIMFFSPLLFLGLIFMSVIGAIVGAVRGK